MAKLFLSFDPFVFKTDWVVLFWGVFVFSSLFLKVLGEAAPLRATFLSFLPPLPFPLGGLVGALSSLFCFMCFMNLVSLYPYAFSPPAHFLFSFTLGGSAWLGIQLVQILKFSSEKARHLTPLGSPPFLLSPMVFFEAVSQFIRPVTLAVRLAANLTTGHLLLSLLSELSLTFSLLPQLLLFVLEGVVSLVQPLVFCMLLYIYFSET